MSVNLNKGKPVNRSRNMAAKTAIIGNSLLVAIFMPLDAQDDVTADGAASNESFYTAWTTTGADDLTLKDGSYIGQLKKIQLIVDGGSDGVLTPNNLVDGTTITFADAGDFCLLLWDGNGWVPIELGNAADGATAPVLA